MSLTAAQINTIYTNVLQRPASTAEQTAWVALDTTGVLTDAQVINDIVTSPEAQQYDWTVARLYQAAFGRVPDQAGFTANVDFLDPAAGGHGTELQLAAAFLASPEAIARFGNVNPSSSLASLGAGATIFLQALYTNVLGRTGSPTEISNWLATGETAAQVLIGFSDSAEFQAKANPVVQNLLTLDSNVNGTPTPVPPNVPVYTGSLFAIPGAGTTNLILTPGIDVPAITSNDTILGTFNGSTGNPSTYTPGDMIIGPVGSSGNVLTVADAQGSAAAEAQPTAIAATVSNIGTANFISGEGMIVNTASSVAGFTGLIQLNVTASSSTGGFPANSTVTAAGTTNIAFTDLVQGNQSDFIQGGLNVVANINGPLGGGSINVGTVTAPLGTVSVNETVSATQTGGNGGDAINVKGGTTVTINANLNEAGGAGNIVVGQAIQVTGTALTTSVTVNQTAATFGGAGNNAVVAAAGSSAVAAVTAAPGVTAVTTVPAVTAAAAAAAFSGVTDGFVFIEDAAFGVNPAAATIKTVSLSNFNNANIESDALATLSLTGGNSVLTNTPGSTTQSTGTTTIFRSASIAANSSLALTVNNYLGTLDDNNNEITTLNVTTAGAKSSMTIQDSGLTTLNVAGTQALTLTGFPASITTIAISGSAGFNDNDKSGVVAGLGTLGATLTSFTTTSSGTITAFLDDTTQTFVGSTGQDVITITKDATKTITGGSATNNELILDNTAATFNATAGHLTTTNVTGFSIMGFGSLSSGTYDMSTFPATFNAIDVTGNSAGAISVIKAATGTSLTIDKGDTQNFLLQYVDTTGASDTTSLTLGKASPVPTTNTVVSFLQLQDANTVGVGTLKVVSNGSDIGIAGGALNTITQLVDNGLGNLTVTGGAGLTVGTLNEATTQATSFTMTSNETGQNGTTITNMTDANLGSLTFAGSNAGAIGTLTLTGAPGVSVLSISDTGTSTGTIGTIVAGNVLTSFTLGNGVTLGQGATTGAESAIGLQDSATTGVTIAGGADNSHVSINLTAGAASGKTDSITLGNANNFVADASTVGTVNVTVGTGSNFIDLHTGLGGSGYVGTVTLGAHTLATGPDEILPGLAGAGSTTPNPVITGAAAGDMLKFVDAGTTVFTLSPSQLATAAGDTLSQAVAFADGLIATAHTADAFVNGGNTFVIESAAAGTGALTANDSLVELVGVHTLSTTVTGNVFTLAT